MKAVVIERPGGPEVLRLRDVPEPECGSGEVRVRVRAAALNRADVLQRRGSYPAPPGVPRDVPGLEFAGEVEACGAGVESLAPGARVMGLVAGGAQAEKVVVHEKLCLRVPDVLSWEEAAAVPEAFVTAHDALVRVGRLAAGEIVLIQAAASGVGTAALQLVPCSGARAIGLSRTADKRRRLRELGVEDVLDPGRPDLVAEIRRRAGNGVDLVLDMLGAGAWPLSVEVLAPRGRLVLIGLLAGSRVEVDLSVVLRKRLTVTGTVLRSRDLEEKAELVSAFASRVLPWFDERRIHPVVDRVFPLSEVADAHRWMERNANLGKIVLRLT
jgi:NADPH2:quinone reductase